MQPAAPASANAGGSTRHYSTVTLDDLKRLPVGKLAEDDCLLFLWATSPHLDQAIELGKAWGFDW
ncbi:MAG: MT-A70 family methyltransferase, partial [Acidobacteria bacterium]|nr:MT-A70 family methyltransferase [Acidobacteriota bacterium]